MAIRVSSESAQRNAWMSTASLCAAAANLMIFMTATGCSNQPPAQSVSQTSSVPITSNSSQTYTQQSSKQTVSSTPLPASTVTVQQPAVPQVQTGNAQDEPNTADTDGANAKAFAYPASNGAQIPASLLELTSAGGFLPSDVKQGSLGDCYFDAALAALISAKPTWLNNLIKPATNVSGAVLVDAAGYPLYKITMSYPSNGQIVQWSYVTDVKLPSDQNGVIFDAMIQDGSMFKIAIPLLEKGYARLDQETNYLNVVGSGYTGTGYQAVGEGGWASSAFPALTGKSAVDVPRTDVINVIPSVLAGDGIAVVADINTGYYVPKSPLPSGATIVSQGKESLLYTGVDGSTLTLTDIHYYSFLGTQGNVTMWRNPWGSVTGTDGIFTLPVADVASIFNTFSLVNLNK